MSLTVIDSHCHLQADRVRESAQQLLDDARMAGVLTVLIPGILPQDAQRDVDLAESLGVWCSVGCHPCHPEDWNREAVLAQIHRPQVVAIGECGLDYFHKPFDAVLQESVFVEQIGIAKDAGLPVILHNRESDADLIAILRREGATNGVFHCFGGDAACLDAALELGFFISFAGNVTYPKATFRELVARVPDDRLLVETDAPWLTPVPDRGKLCTPSHVVHTLREVARLRGQSAEGLGKQTVENFYRAFPKTRAGVG
jgi:TatD DNase family protein